MAATSNNSNGLTGAAEEAGGMEVVPVEIYFGETLPYLPVITEVSVNTTWDELLRTYGIRLPEDTVIVDRAASTTNLMSQEEVERTVAFLEEKVGVLKDKIKSLTSLRVQRLMKVANPPEEKLTWKDVYEQRIRQITHFDVLACLGTEEFVHVDILRNLYSTFNFETIEVNDFSPEIIPKHLLHALNIITEWGTSANNIFSYAIAHGLSAALLRRVLIFLYTRRVERPLLDFRIYVALRKALAETARDPVLDKFKSQGASVACFLTARAEEAARAACRLILTLMPYEKRRVLQILIFSLQGMLNDKFLKDLGQSRSMIIEQFLPLILSNSNTEKYDSEKAIQLVTYLTENYEDIFDASQEIGTLDRIAGNLAAGLPVEDVNGDIKMPARLVETASCANLSSIKWNSDRLPLSSGHFCKQMATDQFETQGIDGTRQAKEQIFKGCVAMQDEKKKLLCLLDFKKKFPETFAEKRGDRWVENANAAILARKMAKREERVRSLRNKFNRLRGFFI